jgi:tRNA threonylcarbamoyladenosine biosynthesis protein TsaB
MLTLALDTCDARGSLAILRDATVLASGPHDSPDDYSIWLLPAVNRTIAAARVRLTDIDLFAVAAGPGSFTGVRAGLTTVKAWLEVYGRPAVAVSRLEALAEQASPSSELVAAFVDARREQLFAALFQRNASGFALLGEESLIAPQDFLEAVAQQANGRSVAWVSLDPQALTRAPAWPARSSLGESVLPADPVLAPVIARLAVRAAALGRSVTALGLDANYLRRPDAEIFWKGSAAHGK